MRYREKYNFNEVIGIGLVDGIALIILTAICLFSLMLSICFFRVQVFLFGILMQIIAIFMYLFIKKFKFLKLKIWLKFHNSSTLCKEIETYIITHYNKTDFNYYSNSSEDSIREYAMALKDQIKGVSFHQNLEFPAIDAFFISLFGLCETSENGKLLHVLPGLLDDYGIIINVILFLVLGFLIFCVLKLIVDFLDKVITVPLNKRIERYKELNPEDPRCKYL